MVNCCLKSCLASTSAIQSTRSALEAVVGVAELCSISAEVFFHSRSPELRRTADTFVKDIEPAPAGHQHETIFLSPDCKAIPL